MAVGLCSTCTLLYLDNDTAVPPKKSAFQKTQSSKNIQHILQATASADAIMNNCNLLNFLNTMLLEDKWLSGSAEVQLSIMSQISKMFKPITSLLKSNDMMTVKKPVQTVLTS